MGPEIKAVLFDFGGVIADEGFRDGLILLATEQGLDSTTIVSKGMQAVYDSGFVLGTGNDSDFWQLMSEHSGITGNETELSKLLKDGFIPRQWMLKLVRQLRDRGFITGILSDQTYWLDELDNKYHFYCEFDHVFNSYYLGKGKLDASLFDDIAHILGLDPSSILFIDDNVGHVERALSRGWQVIQYKDRDDFENKFSKLVHFIGL